jgi:hypothetical protein
LLGDFYEISSGVRVDGRFCRVFGGVCRKAPQGVEKALQGFSGTELPKNFEVLKDFENLQMIELSRVKYRTHRPKLLPTSQTSPREEEPCLVLPQVLSTKSIHSS